MSHVLGGFAWTAEAIQNPSGAVFFLDDIQYEYEDPTPRLNEPRLVRSFRTLDRQPLQPIPLNDFDFKLRAERAGTGDGREYRAMYTATDASGNETSATSLVLVPHDRGGEPASPSSRR